jgi:4a-hydroxytetrahydrobiopterin dehydratase
MGPSDDRRSQIITDSQAAGRLAACLPKWVYADAHLHRIYKTAGWKATLMVINTIGHLAETAWHHPDLHVSYDSVEVKLTTHDAGGLTEKDFDLAIKIEEVVMWQPGRDAESTLQGTPDELRFKYIHYD